MLFEPVFGGRVDLGCEQGWESPRGVQGSEGPVLCHEFTPSTAWGPFNPPPSQHRGYPVSPAFAICL